MKITYWFMIIHLIFFINCNNIKGIDSQKRVPDRPPAVAGQFYPDDPAKLTNAFNFYFSQAVKTSLHQPKAIVVPHAGYIYSGQIAADAYNQAKNFDYDIIVILGTNHTTAGFHNISIYPGGSYITPLGKAEVDAGLAEQLLKADGDITFNRNVHDREHSVEVQIPFIQYLFPGKKILPVVIGSNDITLCEKLGQLLAGFLKNRKPLIVASSDLSHYPSSENARIVDRAVLEAVAGMDTRNIQQVIEKQMAMDIPNLSTCACGEGPILTAVITAKKLNANRGSIVSYASSGLTLIGDPARAVGYGAVVFSKEEPGIPVINTFKETSSTEKTAISSTDKKRILEFAAGCIEQYLKSETLPLPRNLPAVCSNHQGAFVTLKKNGELRGCIGHMDENLPLGEVIGRMALQAAFNDYRFNPLQLSEWSQIKVEISVLTPYTMIKNAGDIRIGIDGVVLEKGKHRAVFLPQVAPEQGWSREQLLDNLCRKAGLSAGSWKEGTRLYVFQADVFSQSDFH